MKIAVCLKRVPDSEARIKIGADAKSIDESGVKFVLNPYEEYAVEEALKLKEAVGSGEVVAISVGSEVSQETIRTALAMGADRGVLLKSDAVPLDPLPVAQALAAELKDGEYDLIVFGKVAIDDYSHGVGVMVAELLGLPCERHRGVGDRGREGESRAGIAPSRCCEAAGRTTRPDADAGPWRGREDDTGQGSGGHVSDGFAGRREGPPRQRRSAT